MNSMKASFAGGVLHSTDYFSSRDYDEGRAWLVLSSCDWHVLLPRIPAVHLTVRSPAREAGAGDDRRSDG